MRSAGSHPGRALGFPTITGAEESWLAAPLEQHLREHRPYAIGAVDRAPSAERDPLLSLGVAALAAIPLRRDACAGLARVLVPAATTGPSERSRTLLVGDIVGGAIRSHATPSGCA